MSLYEETEGAYDITATPLWEAWGFARRAGAIPSDTQLAEARARVGGHLVQLDRERRTIRFRRSGVRINLGSIGKGHALDVCSRRLLELGIADFLFHGGQSSVLARGVPAPDVPGENPSPSRHWEIGIRDPRRPGHRLGIVRLDDRSLGTSSGQFQSFRHQGRRYGHILDPRSGWPAEGMLAVTVVAPTAALADALSTAFYVMGAGRSLEYCRAHPEIGAVLTCPDAAGRIEVHTAGLGPAEVALNEV
jgi:thiamine biosynthesis lipoprotein